MPTYATPEDAPSGLQTLLLRAVPENGFGNKTLTHLAVTLGVSRWAINKWIRKGKIPPERVMQIVEISEGRVKIEDFHAYVYKA